MSWFRDTIAGWFGLATLDEVVAYINQQINGQPEYRQIKNDSQKLEMILSNPAMLKVTSLMCDMFSLGKVYVYKGGKALDTDPFLEMIKRPNPFQSESEFKWDFMFWQMIGNTYVYCDSLIPTEDNSLYVLENHKINFPTEMLAWKDKIILAKSSQNTIDKFNVEYRYADGTATSLQWKYIIHNSDLTKSGNWFSGPSRIDALYKVISNSEEALNAKNVNLRYTAKFIVAGQADPNNVSELPMSETEKKDVESKMNSRRKQVYAMKSMIDIKRFVSDMAALKLDDCYLSDYFTIGSMFGIPKDVLEAFNSSTFENQEKARGAFVSYCLQPKGDTWFSSMAYKFGYKDREIIIDWEHLPFMQVFAKERAETGKIQSETLLNLMKAGVKMEQINEMLDLELTELNYETANRAAQGTGTNQGSNQQPGS